jgi:hypothetical protein
VIHVEAREVEGREQVESCRGTLVEEWRKVARDNIEKPPSNNSTWVDDQPARVGVSFKLHYTIPVASPRNMSEQPQDLSFKSELTEQKRRNSPLAQLTSQSSACSVRSEGCMGSGMVTTSDTGGTTLTTRFGEELTGQETLRKQAAAAQTRNGAYVRKEGVQEACGGVSGDCQRCQVSLTAGSAVCGALGPSADV